MSVVYLTKTNYLRTWSRICALLGYFAANSGNSLPTFRDHVSVLSSRVKNPRKQEGDGAESLFRNVGKELPLLAA